MTAPAVVAFYAYKGGTGRSMALAHTAWALARKGYRVVAIDLDLSAPSLGQMFAVHTEVPVAGFVEHLLGWRLGKTRPVLDLLREVPLDPKAHGALYLLTAGLMDSPYLETLSTIAWRSLVQNQWAADSPQGNIFEGDSFFGQLFGEIHKTVRPDVILIDAPTGLNDTANVVLRHLADVAVVIFGLGAVQLQGIARVVSLLTFEQQGKLVAGSAPRPDVFAIASMVMHPRTGSAHIKKVSSAFEFLDRVRLDAIKSAGFVDQDSDIDRSSQDIATIGYDERLVDLDCLDTRDEPATNQFSMFDDLVRYVEGALPAPPTKSLLGGGAKQRLLGELSDQYRSFAEQDPRQEFERMFLRTQHLASVKGPRLSLVLGGKGSGKTALFRYLTEVSDPNYRAVGVHGPGIGIGSDALSALQELAPMDVVWRTYTLHALRLRFPEFPQDDSISNALDLFARLGREPGVLVGLGAVLSAPDFALRVDRALRDMDHTLGRQVIVCFDGLDSAFKADVAKREKGTIALFEAWQATFSHLVNIDAKIFLRTDLWERLSFPEKSHFKGRDLKLNWDSRDLWRLVVKRALLSQQFANWFSTSLEAPTIALEAIETSGELFLYPYVDLLIEKHIWAGKNSLSRTWTMRRLADARGTVYPRDLLTLIQEAIRSERERLLGGQRVSEEAAISRQSLAEALTPTSRQRVEGLLEELPEVRDVVEALRGLPATANLEMLREALADRVDEKLDVLEKAGVVSLDIRSDEVYYTFPELYRHGLSMSRPGPK